jgi:hypothetical protein
MFFIACRPKKLEENSHFPPSVQIIFTNKCATAGCHNSKSYQNAGGLDLTSWESLFKGSVNGTVVVPFAPMQSSMMQFVNTYADLGLTNTPLMPLNQAALSRNEVLSIRTWIEKGCPNAQGINPYADQATTRGKAYITNQGCDLVSVVDAATGMVMRYIRVGHDPGLIESPHNIKVSADGKYWYVCFSNGSYLQKYDAATDSLAGEVNISAGKWNVITLTADNQTAIISDLSNNGRLAEVNLTTMTLSKTYASGAFSNPHGIAFTKTNDTVYATAQYGNMIYRLIRSVPQVDNISLQKGVAPTLTTGLLDPHEIMMSPDFKTYYVTCQSSNELLVVDAKADTVLKSIRMGDFPLEMALSKKRNCLFITCQEDVNPLFPFFKGSVSVVDLNTWTVVKTLYEKFYQPHGIAVDDSRDLLYVASTNANPSGPAPHHASECAGRNGYFHVIDLNTWEDIISTSELSVFPYSAAVRE